MSERTTTGWSLDYALALAAAQAAADERERAEAPERARERAAALARRLVALALRALVAFATASARVEAQSRRFRSVDGHVAPSPASLVAALVVAPGAPQLTSAA